MNGKIAATIVLGLALVIVISTSCTQQAVTRTWGGSMDIELEPNDKLMEITWKDDDLWILTKKMSDDDVAEEYNFYESSSLGVFEGSINIKETKMTNDELEAYEEQQVLATDFMNSANYGYDEKTGDSKFIYIRYNEDTDTYEKIKEYTYDDNGYLVSVEGE
jgi:hypothetical protein